MKRALILMGMLFGYVCGWFAGDEILISGINLIFVIVFGAILLSFLFTTNKSEIAKEDIPKTKPDNYIPLVLITAQTTLEKMAVGDIAFTTPWSFIKDDAGNIYLRADFPATPERSDKICIQVERHREGFFIFPPNITKDFVISPIISESEAQARSDLLQIWQLA